MGAGVSGVTAYSPNVKYEHLITYEGVLEALASGEGEGVLNLNPSVDFKYRDTYFLSGLERDSRVNWIRAGDFDNATSDTVGGVRDVRMQAGMSEGTEEREVAGGVQDNHADYTGENKANFKRATIPGTQVFFSGKDFIRGRLFPSERDPCSSDIIPCRDKAISYFLAAAMSLTKRVEVTKFYTFYSNIDYEPIIQCIQNPSKTRINILNSITCSTCVPSLLALIRHSGV